MLHIITLLSATYDGNVIWCWKCYLMQITFPTYNILLTRCIWMMKQQMQKCFWISIMIFHHVTILLSWKFKNWNLIKLKRKRICFWWWKLNRESNYWYAFWEKNVAYVQKNASVYIKEELYRNANFGKKYRKNDSRDDYEGKTLTKQKKRENKKQSLTLWNFEMWNCSLIIITIISYFQV